MNLYTLTDAFQQIYDRDDLEVDTWVDTLESIEASIEDKADGYGRIIRNLEAERDAHKQEAKRHQEAARIAENKVIRLKQNMQNTMDKLNMPKIEGELFKWRVQKTAPALKLADDFVLTEEFTKHVEPEPDKTAIKNAIKNGREINGAELVAGQTAILK